MDPNLIYAQALFAPIGESAGYRYLKKISDLAIGIELLGVGSNFHSFNINNFTRKQVDKNKDKYTLYLLFGDVFYSRAVSHLLKFNDSLVFTEILNSLKSVHHSRLLLHREMLKLIENKDYLAEIMDKKIGLLLGINSLFKNTIILGWSLVPKNLKDASEINEIYKLANAITHAKSFIELERFLREFAHHFNLELDMEALAEKKAFIEGQLDVIISKLKQNWLKENFQGITGVLLR
ncbi:MAG: hypothetical protein R6U35_05350 [Candidatus Humimicrobiaceae bacterium]